jgi:hypothetical protein
MSFSLIENLRLIDQIQSTRRQAGLQAQGTEAEKMEVVCESTAVTVI